MEIYRENILDHYKNPRNFGRIAGATGESREENVSCGDEIGMSVRVVDGVIEEVGFEGYGCAVAMASASMLTEKVWGMSSHAVNNLAEEDVVELLGFKPTPSRMRCALLPLQALKSALGGLQRNRSNP